MSRGWRDAIRAVMVAAGLVLAVGGSATAMMLPDAEVLAGTILMALAFVWAQGEVYRYRLHLGARHQKKGEED